MSDIGIQGVLSQIRALREQLAPPTANATAPPGANFGDALTRVVDKVSRSQTEATRAAESFERGDKDTSLVQVMLAMQKAQVQFKAVTEVRNRLVQAYQDIQNMPI